MNQQIFDFGSSRTASSKIVVSLEASSGFNYLKCFFLAPNFKPTRILELALHNIFSGNIDSHPWAPIIINHWYETNDFLRDKNSTFLKFFSLLLLFRSSLPEWQFIFCCIWKLFLYFGNLGCRNGTSRGFYWKHFLDS